MGDKTTHADLHAWVQSQHVPHAVAPIIKAKKGLLTSPKAVIEGQDSLAMAEFKKQYKLLEDGKINSKHAHDLYRAALRAEVATNLSYRLPEAIRKDQIIQDKICQLQENVYAGANWVRRFAHERFKAKEYILTHEKEMANSIKTALGDQVDALFTVIDDKTKSKEITSTMNLFTNQWAKEDAKAFEEAKKMNKSSMQQLHVAYKTYANRETASVPPRDLLQIAARVEELEESLVALSDVDAKFVTEVRTWVEKNEKKDETPWRVKGITSLGPFGIYADLKCTIKHEFPEGFFDSKLVGTYTVSDPVEKIQVYLEALGHCSSTLSPLSEVTIPLNDPLRKLARIPGDATHFAFAYPVISKAIEVKLDTKSHIDSFLLYGGFIYFRGNKEQKTLEYMQTNALWVGSQMQFSAPLRLPEDVRAALESQEGRFHDITLPHLLQLGARKFCWICPSEFPHLQCKHGAYCYLYEDPAVNNYFYVAGADEISGALPAFTVNDIKG